MAALAVKLRPASFRGVPFEVDSSEIEAGRRTQVHDYPQRDKPYTEDLGRAAREIAFSGFVVGADYIDRANQLIGALEEPGPGTLIHPWFGTLKVSLKDSARIAFDNGLGRATFSLSFVESGELTFPSAGDSTQAQSRLAAANLETAAVQDFAGTFSVDGFQDFVSTEAAADLTKAIDAVGDGNIPGLDALGYATKAVDTLQSAVSLLNDPAALGMKLAEFIGVAGVVSSGMKWLSLGQSLIRLSQQVALAKPSAPTIYTPSRQQAYINTTAVNGLVRQLTLAQAVGASSLAPATVYEDTIGLRNTLTAALDNEALTASDTVYDALMTARAQVWRDLTERSRDSARLDTLAPPEVTPALVLAYDYYEDATREGDIVARNAIRHPGFVPAEPLRVLTR